MKYLKFTFIFIVLLMSFGVWTTGCSNNDETTAEHVHKDGQMYTCGMHPAVITDKPGDCPICGMKLVPVDDPSGSTQTVEQTKDTVKGERKILYWVAPMDPAFISDKPGKSPMGMELVPVYEDDQPRGKEIVINPAVVQNIGVRTMQIERQDLKRSIRTIGHIDVNEEKLFDINTKISGWIEKLYINSKGQFHKQEKAPLLRIRTKPTKL